MDVNLLICLAQQKTTIKNEFIEALREEESQQLIKFNKYLDEVRSSEIVEYCKQNKVTIISITDSLYPELLKQIPDPPIVIYAKGNVDLLKRSTNIAIVGTRKCTNQGANIAFDFAKQLANYNITIVSGLAEGIDAYAHKGAVEKGSTIAVLGTGIDVTFPACNKELYKIIEEKGLIITEYVPSFRGEKYTFPERNRIIAGLSRGVLVVESKEKGGSLITADLALSYNREVFAVPGRIMDENSLGTNTLIQKGAKLVLSVEDIVDELNWLMPSKSITNEASKYCLSNDEKRVYESLNLEPQSVDTIAVLTGIPTNTLSSILTFLEMQKIIRQLPGKQFVRN